MKKGLSLDFPEAIPPKSIVMIGLSRPMEFINRCKGYFREVEFHGFLIVQDEIEALFLKEPHSDKSEIT